MIFLNIFIFILVLFGFCAIKVSGYASEIEEKMREK